MILSLTACSDQSNSHNVTTNPVRPIDVSSLDSIVTQKSFSGLVVAMASWCKPCREELPLLADIYQDYQGKGIKIVAVSIDEEGPAVVQPLINKLKIPFPVYWAGTSAVQHYKIVGIPTLFVYGNGRLLEKIPGSQSRRTIEGKIKMIMDSAHP